VVRMNQPVADLLRALEAQGIVAGFNLTADYPELGEAMLVCATETRTPGDIEKYVLQLEHIISKRRLDPPSATQAKA